MNIIDISTVQNLPPMLKRENQIFLLAQNFVRLSDKVHSKLVDMFLDVGSTRGLIRSHNYYANTLWDIIPIYLVTVGDCGKKVAIPFVGYTDSFNVPFDKMPDPLSHDADNSDKPNKDISRSESDSEKCICSYLDLFGIYTREYPYNKPYSKVECTPRIFIWIDKIYAYVNGDNKKFQVLATQVILHELMHGMMDVNLRRKEPILPAEDNLPQWLYTIKEESLANVLSLYFLKFFKFDSSDLQYVHDFVDSQPFQYRLALNYYPRNFDEASALREVQGMWRLIKKKGTFNQNVGNHWLKFIKSNCLLDHTQLYVLDKGLLANGRLNCVLRYSDKTGSVSYYSGDIISTVVKDFIADNPNTTRKNVHVAFPSTLFMDKDRICDLPQPANKLHSKIHKNWYSQLDCQDGQIEIDNHLLQSEASGFVNCVKNLGYDVEYIH